MLKKLHFLYLCFIFVSAFGQQFENNTSLNKDRITLEFKRLNNLIDFSLKALDTAGVSAIFKRVDTLIANQSVYDLDDNLLAIQVKRVHFLMKYKNVSADRSLEAFRTIFNRIKNTEKYAIKSDILVKMSLLFRNKKDLKNALYFNELALKNALKSSNFYEISKIKITELDLLYQLIPQPVEAEDVIPLIDKAKDLEGYMKTHNVLGIMPFSQLYLAKFYVHEQRHDKAKKVLLSIADTNQLRIVFSKYEQLSEIAKQTQNFEDYKFYTQRFKYYAYKTKRPFVALNVHNYLLDYFIKTLQKDSAKYYAKQLEVNLSQVDTTQFLDYVYISYHLLGKYHTSLDVEKSLKYRDYADNVNQQIIANQKKALLEVVGYQNKLNDLQYKNSTLSRRVFSFKNGLGILVFILIVLTIIIILFYKRQQIIKRKTIQIEQEKKELAKKVEKKHIVLGSKSKVYLEGLKYVKAEGNYVYFFTETGKLSDRNTLKRVLEKLPPNFVKVHRSFIVNKNYIKSVNSSHIIVKPDIYIPLSRIFKKNL